MQKYNLFIKTYLIKISINYKRGLLIANCIILLRKNFDI